MFLLLSYLANALSLREVLDGEFDIYAGEPNYTLNPPYTIVFHPKVDSNTIVSTLWRSDVTQYGKTFKTVDEAQPLVGQFEFLLANENSGIIIHKGHRIAPFSFSATSYGDLEARINIEEFKLDLMISLTNQAQAKILVFEGGQVTSNYTAVHPKPLPEVKKIKRHDNEEVSLNDKINDIIKTLSEMDYKELWEKYRPYAVYTGIIIIIELFLYFMCSACCSCCCGKKNTAPQRNYPQESPNQKPHIEKKIEVVEEEEEEEDKGEEKVKEEKGVEINDEDTKNEEEESKEE